MQTRGRRVDYAEAQKNTPYEPFFARHPTNNTVLDTPAMDLAGKWLTPEGFCPKHVHNLISSFLVNPPEQIFSGQSRETVNSYLRILQQIEAAFLASPETNAEEYRELLMGIDEKERQLAGTAAESQNTRLESRKGKRKAGRASSRKPKLKKPKKGVKKSDPVTKREQREKRAKRRERREQGKIVNGLGNLFRQLDVKEDRRREEQMKDDQGTEGGLNEMQHHERHGPERGGMEIS